MGQTGRRIILWAPRVLCILFAIFISMFAMDVFEEAHGFRETVVALAMHMIPTGVILLVTIFAWRFPLVGTIAFLATGLFYIFTFGQRFPSAIPLISGPQFVIAILFLLGWREKRRARRAA
jgi:hypothetical protein